MTDKQIIIDRVDVSEWTDEEIRYNFEKHSPKAIRQIAFDLYKQLKHKEQECEELKRYKSLFEKTRDLRNEASKTNYKLLDEIQDLKDSLKRTICQSECYRYKEAQKLKQTLAKIKEIAENVQSFVGRINIEYDVFEQMEQILQKISEVENE